MITSGNDNPPAKTFIHLSSMLFYSFIIVIFFFVRKLHVRRIGTRRDRIIVGFTITYAISAYHHWSCEFESRWWRGALDTTLCNKVCQGLATGRWFSPGTPLLFTNKTNRHDITEILLRVALNTITLTTLRQNR